LIQAVQLSVPEHFLKGKKLEGEKAKELIMGFDANKNGKIESEEFCNFCKWVMVHLVTDQFIEESALLEVGGTAAEGTAAEGTAAEGTAAEEVKKITGAEFDELLSKLDPEAQELLNSNEFKEECKNQFEAFDTNKNGMLDGDELIQAVQLSVPEHFLKGKKLEGEKAKELIMGFDANKNGKIESEEFCNFCKWVMVHMVAGTFE